ncbi:hypothetical protein COO91_10267 (plasmid) [Nostoc flagelliforme CCNUN1]|uniref:Uncharacterized protein n=1 Tax=Nostoc flagelliforme CCNUN1 TaxID=2038116 RepID=A0A2K8T8R8_9NOSO|nr:hypothetical protein COO91_10267 [Nostoc flagelliforme CCNUN1]
MSIWCLAFVNVIFPLLPHLLHPPNPQSVPGVPQSDQS